MSTNIQRQVLAFAFAAGIAIAASEARAANGAYVVDDADAAGAGQCRVESWASFAANSDFIGAVAPACGIPFFKPAEIGALFLRTRQDGEWGTSVGVKGKMNLAPADVGKLGIAASVGAAFDALTGETQAVFATVPFTFKVTEEFRFHLNAGWLWNPVNDVHFATYGGAVEWEFVKQFTLIGEVFGLIGAAQQQAVIQPRFQAGLRYTPIEALDFDLIYGRNIGGENANWITVGMNVRFSVLEK